MSGKQVVALLSIGFFLFAAPGCIEESQSGGSASSNTVAAPTAPTGTYAGTWTGKVCGRGLTMIINQSGLSLSGSYALTDPDFGEAMSGSVSSEAPPATATLLAGSNRRYEITFNSFTAFTGGFFKGSSKVCDVTASKQ